MAKPVIKLDTVWKIYQMGDVKVEALRGLSLEVKKGEFLAVQGPSGSGKSTAVNMIGCLDFPTKGKILLDGQNISELSESRLAQIRGRKIGFVFQQFNLIPTLTAFENVMLPMIFQGKSEADRRKSAEDLLKKVDLGDRMHHRPQEMSGGQQQRVAVARALANDPEVILADEPTGNLDSKTGKHMMELLKNLNRKDKKTIVMVTHDSKLSEFAEKRELLMDGKIANSRNGKNYKE